jgi:hypothetical protein
VSRAAARAAAWNPPAQNPVYRIPVTEEGIYRMTGAWLEAKGVDTVSLDLDRIRLYNQGEETAIHVYDQDGNTQLDAADYIEFYGLPVPSEYAKYTDTNVYWLTDSGVSGALRMGTIEGLPDSAQVPITHTATVRSEQDAEYFDDAPGADTLDRWFFSSFVFGAGFVKDGDGNPVPVDFTLSLPHAAGQGTLTLSMWGFNDMDHEVEISLNGTPLGTYTWSGIAFFEPVISDVNLLDGDNTVTLKTLSGTDPLDPDLVIVDWIEAAYPMSFAAHNDTLKFSYEAGYRFKVSGFLSDDLLAFEVTQAGDVKRILGFQPTGTGPYTLEMEPQTDAGERTYLVLSEGETKTPVDISEDTPSSLADETNGADYILITHRDLGWDGTGDQEAWLSDPDPRLGLVALRESQGLRVEVVDVADIYDEFSYGLFTPQAIKDFLAHAYENWTPPAPQYVLLVGDATFDFKDNLGFGTVNYVPSYTAFTEFKGETVTDEWFVRISGEDAVPDLYIGRLPAATRDQARVMVEKILAYEDYENFPNTKTWEKNVLLVADDQEEEYEAVFETINREAAALIPPAMNAPSEEYLGDYVDPELLKTAIKDKINDGTLIVNYSGHGHVQLWAHDIFTTDDVAGLTNTGMLPFFVAMTCLNGDFSNPEAWNFPSMAEALLRSQDKGAIAAFMSTGRTEPYGQRILDRALFDALFTQDIRALGPAISSAKQVLLANGSQYEETSEVFLLFGDPAMSLKIPLPRRPTGFEAEGKESRVELSWQAATDANDNPVDGYNLYRSATPGGSYTKVNTELITETAYTDASLESGALFYYVVRSVDLDGDESVSSEERGVTVGSRTLGAAVGSGSSSGGGCFINTVLAR